MSKSIDLKTILLAKVLGVGNDTSAIINAVANILKSMSENRSNEQLLRDLVDRLERVFSEKLSELSSTIRELVNRINQVEERVRKLEEGSNRVSVTDLTSYLDGLKKLYEIEDIIRSRFENRVIVLSKEGEKPQIIPVKPSVIEEIREGAQIVATLIDTIRKSFQSSPPPPPPPQQERKF